MDSLSFIVILLGHWTGDYLFQTSKMADFKKSSIVWLSIHVATYSFALFIFSIFLLDTLPCLKFVGVNAVLHWITDFFTSKWSARFINNPRVFFPIIGFDQLIHTTCLVYTLEIYINRI